MAKKMKSSEERLRKALELLNGDLRTCPKCRQWVPLHGHAYGCIVRQALAASETADLDRLAEWLKRRSHDVAHMRDWAGYEKVLEHIADTFGVGEGG